MVNTVICNLLLSLNSLLQWLQFQWSLLMMVMRTW